MKLTILFILGLTSSLAANAQFESKRISDILNKNRAQFVSALPETLAKDEETTILRAYLLKSFICQVDDNAARRVCEEIGTSEELDGQNLQLLDFALSQKTSTLFYVH
jgi:hypothetical protein